MSNDNADVNSELASDHRSTLESPECAADEHTDLVPDDSSTNNARALELPDTRAFERAVAAADHEHADFFSRADDAANFHSDLDADLVPKADGTANLLSVHLPNDTADEHTHRRTQERAVRCAVVVSNIKTDALRRSDRSAFALHLVGADKSAEGKKDKSHRHGHLGSLAHSSGVPRRDIRHLLRIHPLPKGRGRPRRKLRRRPQQSARLLRYHYRETHRQEEPPLLEIIFRQSPHGAVSHRRGRASLRSPDDDCPRRRRGEVPGRPRRAGGIVSDESKDRSKVRPRGQSDEEDNEPPLVPSKSSKTSSPGNSPPKATSIPSSTTARGPAKILNKTIPPEKRNLDDNPPQSLPSEQRVLSELSSASLLFFGKEDANH